MSGLRQIGLMVAVAGALALGGCQTTLMDELSAAGERIDRAAGSPTLALQHALANAGEALKGPDLSAEAQKAYGDRLAAEAFQRLPMASDAALERHLTGMANRIAAQAAGPHFTYRVYLVDAKEPNAFTPGGGHIFVTTGLVARLGNEAQMAMVLGHEIAHSVAGHIIKTAQRRQISQKAASAGKTVFNDKLGVSWVGDGLGMAVNAAFNLYTRDQEDEADEAGLDYMIAAGYDLREAEKAIQALMGDGGGDEETLGDVLFGDHSSKARRMQRLRNLIVAKYSRQDLTSAVRTTAAYERVSLSYR
jgi:predicted Zn-dependent protease